MNPSYKSTIDDAIASNFRERIATLEKEIANVKAALATSDQEYKRMISEDLNIVSEVGIDTFTSRYVTYTTKLRKYKEDLKDVNAAYCDWKSLANYAD